MNGLRWKESRELNRIAGTAVKGFAIASALLIVAPVWSHGGNIVSSFGFDVGGGLRRDRPLLEEVFRSTILPSSARTQLPLLGPRGGEETGTKIEDLLVSENSRAARGEQRRRALRESAAPPSKVPQRIRRVRQRLQERREIASRRIRERRDRRKEVRQRRLQRVRRVFRQMMTGLDPAFREAVWSNPREQIRVLRQRLVRARKLRDVKAERAALVNLGQANLLVGRFRAALRSLGKEAELARAAGDVDGEATALRTIGTAHNGRGRYREALRACRESLAMFRKSENRRGEGLALNSIGLILRNSDNYRAAVEALSAALKLDTQPGETTVVKLMNLGELHAAYFNNQAAEHAFKEALTLSKTRGDFETEAETLIRLADVQTELGRHERALESLKEALAVLESHGRPTNIAKERIGEFLLNTGQLAEAEPYLTEAGFDASLGRYYLAKNDLSRAREHFGKLRESAEADKDLESLFAAYTGLGLVNEVLGDLRNAEQNFEQGMKILEDIRSTLVGPDRRKFYSGAIDGFPPSASAKGLTRVRMKRGKYQESIYPSELTKAREFSDYLSQRADLTNFRVPAKVREQEAELQSVLSSLIRARTLVPRELDQARYEEISREIAEARYEFRSFLKLLRKEYPEYAAVRHPQPVDLKRSQVRTDEYVVMLDVVGSGVGVKLTKGKKLVKATFVPMDSQALGKWIRKFREPFERVELAKFDDNLAAELFNKILGPVIDSVPQREPLTVIPDGILALVPFEALVMGGSAQWEQAKWGPYPKGLRFVGDSHPIRYYQSLTALTLARRFEKERLHESRLLVFADPVFQKQDPRAQGTTEIRVAKTDGKFTISLMNAIRTAEGGQFALDRLSETGELAQYLERLYGDRSDVFTGLDASKGNLLERIGPDVGHFSVLVFATHGLATNRIPGIAEPALALSAVPEGMDMFLTMSEVMGMNLNAELAALTACQSGSGEVLAGEGVMSMGRAFQAAGAKAVLMSLWSVSENASVSLMESFFKHVKEGKPKLQAWQLARRELRDIGFDHPFFWAPFVLVGEVD